MGIFRLLRHLVETSRSLYTVARKNNTDFSFSFFFCNTLNSFQIITSLNLTQTMHTPLTDYFQMHTPNVQKKKKARKKPPPTHTETWVSSCAHHQECTLAAKQQATREKRDGKKLRPGARATTGVLGSNERPPFDDLT